MTVFFRVLDEPVEQKASKLHGAVLALRQDEHTATELDPAAFSAVPGSPFAYWVSEEIRAVFQRFEKFESEDRSVRQGLATADDFRFLRTWWEVASKDVGSGWFSFAKGGSFSPFHADIPLVLEWRDGGAVLKAKVIAEHGNAGKRIYNEEFYFRAGVTWPIKNRGTFKPRCLPAGCAFAHVGPCAFFVNDHPRTILASQALMSSSAFTSLVRTMAGWNYEVGIVQRTPFPALGEPALERLARLARRGWSLKRSIDTVNETSHTFLLPPGPNETLTGLEPTTAEREVDAVQRQIDDEAYQLYGLGEQDRAAIEASLNGGGTPAEEEAEADDDVGITVVGAPAEALKSWLVGVVFGRFDPRLATGERPIPPEPEPFDPLPSRSPGMYSEGEEPADRPEILVDDEGHPDDLAARAQIVAEHVKVDVSENLRGWLAREFFPLHIKMYSKSRRKAPIYWQLSTPSASYSVWLYIHAFNKDTLFRVQNDYIGGERGKLSHEERRLESLANELRDGATAAQRKQLAAQEALVEELRAYLDEVKRVAPLWKPNLDDGVTINFAPLWRLVPQNKAWQKELKSTWDALYEGKYDWAHLAMHLWPERVVPKCATDRSLAIAHGLEDVFWIDGSDGKWTARKTPTKSVEDLVKERTAPAVRSALKSLLEAPVASGKSTGRGRGTARRKGAAAVEGDT